MMSRTGIEPVTYADIDLFGFEAVFGDNKG
jgi:hypothetical protein